MAITISKTKLPREEIRPKYLKIFKELTKNENLVLDINYGDLDIVIAIYLPPTPTAARKNIASFQMRQMLNCCGMVVFTRYWAMTPELGVACHKMAQEIAKTYDYTMMVCTDVEDSHRAVLRKCRWTQQLDFVNKKTDRTIYMATKKV